LSPEQLRTVPSQQFAEAVQALLAMLESTLSRLQVASGFAASSVPDSPAHTGEASTKIRTGIIANRYLFMMKLLL
jgi:hypothetical protein